jgi:glycogen debranching enzyme
VDVTRDSDLCCLLSAGVLAPGEPAIKPGWADVLRYVLALRQRCLCPAEPPLRHAWLNIGPGYCYGPAFGHFDLVHEVLDLAADAPDVARHQMLNLLSLQREDGTLPFVWMGENAARTWLPPGTPMAQRLKRTGTYPPLWPVGVEACLALRADEQLLSTAYKALCRQLAWFDARRSVPGGGYFYEDFLGTQKWESGMDQGIRSADPPKQLAACVDATSHVFWCRRFAAAWARRLGQDAGPHEEAVAALGAVIQRALFCEDTAWFHDAWTVNDPARRHLAFEGMWPLVVGAASVEQAEAALTRSLLNAERFNTPHPIATVARSDPAFEARMWRGPAWNSMTLWAAEACLRCGRPDGARELLEKALDRTAAQFARTGTVWEFYHPLGGEPEGLVRKPDRGIKGPCRDYYGHNPLHAMARAWAGVRRPAN